MLKSLHDLGDWEWRLRDLWRVVELDEQRRFFHNQTLALESVYDSLEAAATKIGSAHGPGDLKQISDEIIELRAAALTSHSEKDLYLRRRAYDKGLRAILKTQHQALSALANMDFRTTERGRYAPTARV